MEKKHNREWYRKYSPELYLLYRDSRLKSRKKYYNKNKKKYAKYNKEYQKKNAEKIKKQRKEYYDKNREKILIQKSGKKVRNSFDYYTSWEDEILLGNYGIFQAREIMNFLTNRSCNSIRHRANRLGLGSNNFSNHGEKNPMYKDGNGKKPYPMEWNNFLKDKIRDRDKKCAICSISRISYKVDFGWDLQVHHIDRDKTNLDEFNLICLCLSCHSKIQKFQDDLKDFFYAKNLNLL